MASSCPVCGVGVSDLSTHLELHSKQEVVLALLTHQRTAPGQDNVATGPNRNSSSPHLRKTLNNVSIVNNFVGTTAGCSFPGTQTVPLAATATPNIVSVAPSAATGITTAASASLIIPTPAATVPVGGPLSLLCSSGSGGETGGLSGGSFFPVNLLASLASTPLLLPQINGPTLLLNVPTNYVTYHHHHHHHHHQQQQQHQQPTAARSGGGPAPLVLPAGAGLFATAGGPFAIVSGSGHPFATASPCEQDTLSSIRPTLPEETQNTTTEETPLRVGSSGNSLPPAASVAARQPQRLEESQNDGAAFEGGADGTSNSGTQSAEPAVCEEQTAEGRYLSVISRPVEIHPPTASSSSQISRNKTADRSPHQNVAVQTTVGSSSGQSGGRVAVSSVIVSPSWSGGGASQLPVSEELENTTIVSQQPITVDTVEDLRSALASEADVQLVVSNHLLDTPEFRALMQNMEQQRGEEDETGQRNPLVDEEEEETVSSLARFSTQTTPEESRDGYEVSCNSSSSRSFLFQSSHSNSDSILSSVAEPTHDEEDMTLQDLIAVETIDESQMPEDDEDDEEPQRREHTASALNNREDDMSWTNQLSLDSFQYISQVLGYSGPFRCENCGLHYTSLDDCRDHASRCSKSLTAATTSATTAAIGGTAAVKHVKGGGVVVARVKIEDDSSNSSSSLCGGASIKGEASALATGVKSEPTVDGQDLLAASGRSWQCGQCRVPFPSGPELLQHLETMRLAEIKCSKCHILFQERQELVAHRRTIHQKEEESQKPRPKQETKEPDIKEFVYNLNGEALCEVCERAFKNTDQLIAHMACHVEAKPFECLQCGKRFMKMTQLREHRRRHFEPGPYACQLCEKRFYRPNKLKEHMRTHTGQAPLKCEVCGKGFKRHSNLSEHRRVHDTVKVERPKLELFCHCGQMFSTQRELDWHVEGEHERKPKKCNFCGDVFVHSTHLTRHIRLKHESSFVPEDKKHSLYRNCPLCDQVFYKTSINKHIRVIHQGIKSFTCEICKRSFVTNSNLVDHMWQHKNQRLRPFKCKLCPKAYLREKLLQQHVRSHQGLKPFVCNECGAQFTMKGNFKRHVEEHSGQRNFVCPECNKSFSRSYYLSDHMKVHSGEKPYICGICGKTSATRSNYNCHLKTHVTREPVNSEV